jgi:hypothetical protein
VLLGVAFHKAQVANNWNEDAIIEESRIKNIVSVLLSGIHEKAETQACAKVAYALWKGYD